MKAGKSKKPLITLLIVCSIIELAVIGLMAFRLPHRLTMLVKTDDINRIRIEGGGDLHGNLETYQLNEDEMERMISAIECAEFRFSWEKILGGGPYKVYIEYNDGTVTRFDQHYIVHYGSSGEMKHGYALDLMTFDFSCFLGYFIGWDENGSAG